MRGAICFRKLRQDFVANPSYTCRRDDSIQTSFCREEPATKKFEPFTVKTSFCREEPATKKFEPITVKIWIKDQAWGNRVAIHFDISEQLFLLHVAEG